MTTRLPQDRITRDEHRATETSELLTTLRSRLTDTDSRDYVSRSDRRSE